ncbi:quinon protein alcohol dehydrogenase-like superfamily [Podospora didyma]|uniref:Quinon protein alcohol dehydrogenase-like superfamily n=1 Tax=Podospora didyma TaxID=330526 RepID=A0AAE0NGE8_9PEZI|nr:quinon protein alcohol dehydrogenase-like superfamily [Podospora didyma]
MRLRNLANALLLSIHTAAAVAVAAATDSSSTSNSNSHGGESPWIGWGGNIFNNRWASTNTRISSRNINTATIQCKIPVTGGVSASPTIIDGIAYYPVWDGTIVALNYKTCTPKWTTDIKPVMLSYGTRTPAQAAIVVLASRSSIVVDTTRRIIYFTTQTYALVVVADLDTGRVLASKQLNKHPLAQITATGTLVDDVFFVGVSSAEENIVAFTTNYTCCSFVGNAAAVKFSRSGPQGPRLTLLWSVDTLPADDPRDPGTWSGVGVWGSAPPVDLARNLVFFATGNVYSVPDRYVACTASPRQPGCLPERVWQESVLAFDMTTGKLRWIRRLGALDAWVVACTTGPTGAALCPFTPGPDADFGMAPTFVPGGGRNKKDVLVIGQKDGVLWNLAAATGEIEWSTVVGPSGTAGGLSWGVSVDSSRVYFTVINNLKTAWRPLPANDTVITNSAYGSVLLSNGAVVYETPAPRNLSAVGPPTVVGDIVLSSYGVLTANQGGFVVTNKATGAILWELPLDAYLQSGISVSGNNIFFGTGYHAVYSGFFYVLSVS